MVQGVKHCHLCSGKVAVNYFLRDSTATSLILKKSSKNLIELLGVDMQWRDYGEIFAIDTAPCEHGAVEVIFVIKEPGLSLIDPAHNLRPKVDEALIKQLGNTQNRSTEHQKEKRLIIENLQDPSGNRIATQLAAMERKATATEREHPVKATSPLSGDNTCPDPSRDNQIDLLPTFQLNSSGEHISLKGVDQYSHRFYWEGTSPRGTGRQLVALLSALEAEAKSIGESPRSTAGEKENAMNLGTSIKFLTNTPSS